MSTSPLALSQSGPCQTVRLMFQNQTRHRNAAQSSAGGRHRHEQRLCDHHGSLQHQHHVTRNTCQNTVTTETHCTDVV